MTIRATKFRESPIEYFKMKVYWMYSRLSAGQRVLPDFLIIGTQKGGTSSLNRYLFQHPDVIPAFKKEVHYFDLNYKRGISWYRAHFPPQRKLNPGQITGDASPYYMFFPLAAERARRLVPEAKIIVALRNPVDRAYSHYNHNVRYGRETRSFEEAIEGEFERIDREEILIEEDSAKSYYNHRHFSYLSRGLYARQLSRWLSRYDREKIIFLSSENLFKGPRETFRQVTRFLNLKDWTPTEFKAWNIGKYPAMKFETRDALIKVFEKPNQKLFELIGEDFSWGGSAEGMDRI